MSTTFVRTKQRESRRMTAWQILGGSNVLGSRAESNLAWHRLIKRGFPFQTVAKAAAILSLSDRTLAEFLGISKSTFDRRKLQGRLEADESERVYRAARLFAEALNVFEGVDKAAKWFGEPNRALGGHKPIEMLATEVGSREVENILGRLLYGAYS